ncbi:hypothetical protein [Niabella aurantiaca]|uniref:hypothetical protein n=1 Tax=Niabella aurantiaca TaxID=379900 RepID=UPI0003752B1C|nr:hypothetical protein [Niabella aurantiaca]
MRRKFIFLVFLVVLFCVPVFVIAQTVTTIESGGYYTALTKDASGNIYTTRYNAGSDRYDLIKYTNGAGSPQVILGGLPYVSNGYPWGVAVASNGDIYVASYAANNIIKLPYNSSAGSYGTATTLVSGNYYSALVIDAADNLYTLEYASATSDYAIVKYPAGSAAGTQLYHGLVVDSGYQVPTGLAFAPNGDIYVTDGFNSNAGDLGAVYHFTESSNYTAHTTISSNKYSSSVALDPQGNLYVAEYNGSTYVLNLYSGGGGTPVKITDLELGSDFYPWGVVALNSKNIYFVTGSSGSGGALKHLLTIPEVPASNISFTGTTASSTTISWTNGSGVRRSVFMRAGSTGTASPANGTVYTANTLFGSGSQIGSSGWFCIYSGTGNTVNVTGLSATTGYRVMVIEDNGSSYYQAATAINNPVNVTTTAALSVTFGPISAILGRDALKVQWTTVAETNNDYFEVQASVNGEDFQTLGRVSAKAVDGDGAATRRYAFEQNRNKLSHGWMVVPFIVLLLLLPGMLLSKRRSAFIFLLGCVIATGSCTKSAEIGYMENRKLYIRIVSVDQEGVKEYSKVVIAKEEL